MKRILFVLAILLLVVALTPQEATCVYCGQCQGCPYVNGYVVQLHAKDAPHAGLTMWATGSPLPQWKLWCMVEDSSDGHLVLRLLEGPYIGYWVDTKDTLKPPPPLK